MANVRKVLPPVVKSKNFTLAEARAVFREIRRQQEARLKKTRDAHRSVAKAG